jgi:hypothetical protein
MKIFKPTIYFYIMSESGGVTVFSKTGTLLKSIGGVVADFSTIASIAISVGVSTNQAYCLTTGLSSRMKKAFSIDASERAQAFSIYPALSAVDQLTRNPITNLEDLIRHGIVVETTDPETNRPIYFYIGGVSSAWITNGRIQRLFVAQGGIGFHLQTPIFNDQINYAVNKSKYPIIVTPLKITEKYENFTNPPNATCSSSALSQALNYMQSSSLWWATFIPNYVGSIIFQLSKYPNFYGYSKSSYRWYLTGTIRELIKAISGEPPLFYAGLSTLPQLDQFGLGTIQIANYNVYDFTNSYPYSVGSSYLTYPFPLLNGAPAYTDMLCKGGDNCSGLSIAGFVVAPGGFSWYNVGTTLLQAQLIPATNDFSFNGIIQYANQLGQYTWVDKLLQKVRKAFKVISILVSNFGWLEKQAEKAVYALEWFGSEFEKSAEEIAQDIVNEFSKPEHSESEHTDEAGMEVHKAYMCVRFGLCE